MNRITKTALCVIPIAAMAPVAAQQIRLHELPGVFEAPNGIDFHHGLRKLIVSEHYPLGAPHDLEQVGIDGLPIPYSPLRLGTDELKLAIAHTGSAFPQDTLFAGNGRDGEILRISPDGATVINPWVVLPGTNHGLFRGSLFVDNTGIFQGDLLAVTTLGEVWRVNSAGTATRVAAVNTHLEGLLVVPTDVAKYGPLSGKLLAGAEDQGLLYAFDTAGNFVTYQLGVAVEDIDLIVPCENFYGVQYDSDRVLCASGVDFANYANDILLTQEWSNPGSSGLYRLYWDGSAVRVQELMTAAATPTTTHWEHVTFAPLGIAPLPDCEATPSGTLMGTLGVPITFSVAGRDGDPSDLVTLSVTGLPTGAAMNPPLPRQGNPVNSTFTWTPRAIGRYRIVFTSTDLGGRRTQCCVDLEIAECYLLLGFDQINLVWGTEHLYTTPVILWPVTMESVPPIGIPNDPRLAGLTFYNQVVMFNAISFPNHPVQTSNGLAVTIGGSAVEYGVRSGLQSWTRSVPRIGTTFQVEFRIL
jgi:hypothetical protein